MEQDFNMKHWTNPCPKYDCRKNNCKCGLRYVNIPAVLGDDSDNSDVAPKNGLYCNTIVRYEANGAVYLYSKEGIPILITREIPAISNRIIPLEITNASNANWIIPSDGDFGMSWVQGDIISDNLEFRDDIGRNLTLEALYNMLENGEQFLINISSFGEFAIDENIWESRDDMGGAKVLIGKNKTRGLAVKSWQVFEVNFYYGLANVLSRRSVGEHPLEFSNIPIGIGKIDDQYVFTAHIYGYDFN